MHKDLIKLLVLACLAACVLAKPKPRFIAIPLEDVQLVEVEDLPGSSLVRVPRQIQSSDQSADASRHDRQAAHDHHEYVDFGAHTGHHGSFGWYADFPVKEH